MKTAPQPLIIYHTGIIRTAGKGTNSADMPRRPIIKEPVREVADAGGVISVWRRLVVATTEYVATIRDMVEAVGVDHAGIGSDTNLTASCFVVDQ
jgi:membrane dipeptidase